MELATTTMTGSRRIALIAHDSRKYDLLDWARFNRLTLARHQLLATGTTGSLLAEELGLEVQRVRSGPFGGDQQIGARIAQGEVDVVIFFWDPMQTMAHESDIRALLRLAALYNVPAAYNRATADFLISSPFMEIDYDRSTLDGTGQVPMIS